MREQNKHRRVIVWMRRALRVDDNTALHAALQHADEVIPFLCLDPSPRYRLDSPRRRFIAGTIRSLDNELRERGSRLFVREGRIVDELPAAALEWNADAVYAATVYDDAALKRDDKVRVSLQRMGKDFVTLKDRVVFEGAEILNKSNQPFKVFTPYKRVWLEKSPEAPPLLPPIKSIKSPSVHGYSLPKSFPKHETDNPRSRLRSFLKNAVGEYKEHRDFPGIDGTSKLSPALSVGSISIRRILWETLAAKKGAGRKGADQVDTFISELVWREFYYQILANFPHVTRRSFRDEFVNLRWSESTAHFEAWKSGRTGYPIVDAGMRQLAGEGWMHNRVRMIVASFLTKDLHINWQWGEKFFFDHLCDADIASNNGGWQWTAGTGTDASPWFRIFNPVSQGQRFDPEGAYVRRYVPELANVSGKHIHTPWKLDRQQQMDVGVRLGKDYPAPIVDHAVEREVTMGLYKAPGSPVKKSRKSVQLAMDM